LVLICCCLIRQRREEVWSRADAKSVTALPRGLHSPGHQGRGKRFRIRGGYVFLSLQGFQIVKRLLSLDLEDGERRAECDSVGVVAFGEWEERSWLWWVLLLMWLWFLLLVLLFLVVVAVLLVGAVEFLLSRFWFGW
jgi:hypothetical protein